MGGGLLAPLLQCSRCERQRSREAASDADCGVLTRQARSDDCLVIPLVTTLFHAVLDFDEFHYCTRHLLIPTSLRVRFASSYCSRGEASEQGLEQGSTLSCFYYTLPNRYNNRLLLSSREYSTTSLPPSPPSRKLTLAGCSLRSLRS